MDNAKFFAGVRASLFSGRMNQRQVDGCNVLLNVGGDLELQQLAYVLATALHETAHTMQPIEEYGKGKGHDYGVKDPETGKVYYGRGFVQLTWKANYRKAGDELGIDLVSNPERALRTDIAARIIITGMVEGWFTGRKLSDYIDGSVMLLTNPPRPKVDYLGARRIVNGTDKAKLIAGYAIAFETALREAGYAAGAPVDADPAPSPPSDALPPPADTVPPPVLDSRSPVAQGIAVAAMAVLAGVAAWAGDVWHWIVG